MNGKWVQLCCLQLSLLYKLCFLKVPAHLLLLKVFCFFNPAVLLLISFTYAGERLSDL